MSGKDTAALNLSPGFDSTHMSTMRMLDEHFATQFPVSICAALKEEGGRASVQPAAGTPTPELAKEPETIHSP